MASAREQLVALLKAAFDDAEVDPTPLVKGFAAGLDITQRTVLVMPEEITPLVTSPRYGRTYEFSVLAIANASLPSEEAEAQLDELTADTLDALDSVAIKNDVTWSVAKRATYDNKAPAYLITATTPLVND